MVYIFNRWKEIWIHRELLYNLTKKDIKIKYKNSVLGVFWSLLNPIMLLIVYTIAFNIVLRIQVENFSLFLFTGLVPWIFFQMSLMASSNSILINDNLVKKVYFPREIIPLSVIGGNLFTFILTMLVVLFALLVGGIPAYIKLYLLIPIIIIQLILMIGLSLTLSSLTVRYRDIGHLLEVFLNALFYLTPIIYMLEMVPENYQKWMLLNPLTSIITLYRKVLFEGVNPPIHFWLYSLVVAMLSLAIGHFIFGKISPYLSDEL